MPLQNRVDPYGNLAAVAARGTLTGNRGVLHDEQRQIVRRHQTTRWIACRLDYGDRRRVVMTPKRWTELFFLDEATALAAGHRPCFFCRRDEATRFAAAWNAAAGRTGRARAAEMDRVLDAARSRSPARAVDPGDLPDGVLVELDGGPWLVVEGFVRPWSFEGYGAAQPARSPAMLITPAPILSVIGAGYRTGMHPSARA